MMSYFNDDFVSFFKELSQNNRKEWFHVNKPRYEKNVKQAFEKFIAVLILRIQEHDPSFRMEAKECILRINKDIRFSKDKSPYNLHYTAFVSKGGRKDKSIPGIFLRFSAEGIDIMGGCYAPDKEQLKAIRSHIAAQPSVLKQLASANDFKSVFGAIQGEINKKIPLEFQAAYDDEPLIANKQFYFVAHEPVRLITSPDLPDVVMQYWLAARPLNEYFSQAISPALNY